MKVILLSNINNYGKKGDVIEICNGFGKNYLLPKKLAIIATSTTLKINQKLKEKNQLIKLKEIEYFKEIQKKLSLITLNFKLKTNNNKIYGSISSKQIYKKLIEKYNIKINKHKFIKFSPSVA